MLDQIPADFAETRDKLQRAAITLGTVNLDPLPAGVGADGIRIEADSPAGRALGHLYDWAWGLLGSLPARSGRDDLDPSPVRLWPEHFDVSIELGNEAAGHRATCGVSPGDEHHDEPYVYITPWTAKVSGPEWNARGFPGAEMPWCECVAGGDALDFLAERLEAIYAID